MIDNRDLDEVKCSDKVYLKNLRVKSTESDKLSDHVFLRSELHVLLYNTEEGDRFLEDHNLAGTSHLFRRIDGS